MDFGNLLNPTAASSKKGPEKPFRNHQLSISKPRSIPADNTQPVNMKPRPVDRLDLNSNVTKGRYSKWDGESSMPVLGNNAWWKGEAAGLQGTIAEQRRARQNPNAGDDGVELTGKSLRQAKRQKQAENELLLTRDRFGREMKDAVRSGKFDEEKKPNLAEATARKTLDAYDKTRVNSYRQFGVRCQYIQDCTDVIHRDWKNRYSCPPQARDADAVTKTLENSGLFPTQQQSDANSNINNNNNNAVVTYRVLPPLKEVEKVYHMSRGGANNQMGKRFASPFAKNERSAREGYINNDNNIGRTTPVGDRESASNAPKLSCLALATKDAKRTEDDDERNHQSDHRPSFSMSRNVVISEEGNAGEDAEERKRRQHEKFRPKDSSNTRLAGLQRPDRVAAHRGVQFSTIPSSVLRIMQPAGL